MASKRVQKSARISWTPEEDDLLRKSVAVYGGKNWKYVALNFTNRKAAQCAHRWNKVLNPEIKKGNWTEKEDHLLLNSLIKCGGPGKWSLISQNVPGRNGKQCRERWHNHLTPAVTKEPWSEEEDKLIIHLQQVMGSKWAEIARNLPGRTENSIKNRWNAKLCYSVAAGGSGVSPKSRSKGSNTRVARSRARANSDASSLASTTKTLALEALKAGKKTTTTTSLLKRKSVPSPLTLGEVSSQDQVVLTPTQTSLNMGTAMISPSLTRAVKKHKFDFVPNLATSSEANRTFTDNALKGMVLLSSISSKSTPKHATTIQPTTIASNKLEWFASLATQISVPTVFSEKQTTTMCADGDAAALQHALVALSGRQVSWEAPRTV